MIDTLFVYQTFISTNSKFKALTFHSSPSLAMAIGYMKMVLPPSLDSTSNPPPLFDGTTRLYISYKSPYSQRVWITRNYKGLQDKIKLVPLNLQNRPIWYKEKVYPENKVPSLEHNRRVIGESIDLIQYVDSNFEGPPLFPNAPAERKYGMELLSYSETFARVLYDCFKGDTKEADFTLDYLEACLQRFDEGPFFLGQISLVDIAYIPFVERFYLYLLDVWKNDIVAGRPQVAAWMKEMNNIDAYTHTKFDPKELVEFYKKRFLVQQ
ncbi:GST_C_2 domain-containing protein/GST_N_3 domain-containing protein [Cephalotus follicularis]|uniref:GST_C_2 domain-containing protein/GST_N_3 domain-containing protein n=1 Tax=Cephalotus follicularis TaxID=3775 RepID=A0A1Q3CVV2_CEPFO|nr:GST_C_2 domain-containing protein/GST_N_3 domain-containing protein [Cephalotus follicularis]